MLQIRKRIFQRTTLAISLVLLLGALSFVARYEERKAEELINNTLLVKAKIQELRVGFKDNASAYRAKRRYRDASNLPQPADRELLLGIIRDLGTLVKDDPDQIRRSQDLQQEITELFALWESIDPKETWNNVRLEEGYFRKEQLLLESLNSSLAEMEATEDYHFDKRTELTLLVLKINNMVNIGGTLIIVLIVLGLGSLIRKEFRKRRIAELSLREKMEEQSQQSQKTALQNKILSGTQDLMRATQEALDVPEFMRIALECVLQFTGMPSGVAYVAGSGTEQLRPVYSRGIPSGGLKDIAISGLLTAVPGEEEKCVVYVRNIPAEFWEISSASGRKQPGTIVYVFIRLKERVLAVLELASFDTPSEKQRQYLATLSEVLGIRMAALQLAESRDFLLEELQEKQTALLAQQEELRHANEELISQTQTLQASEEELKVQEEELKQINTELEKRNEALEHTKREIIAKASELEQSGKYKSEFLANMSHELRTPLNSILILASLLGDNKDRNLTAKQVEYARIISNAGTELLKLINDILDLSKIESGKVELNVETFSLKTTGERMYEMFRAAAEQKKIRFDISVDAGDTPDISTDMQRLEQILRNLLSNAIKFTPDEGTVRMDIRRGEDGFMDFSVTDTGIGIDVSKQQLIFEAFRQEDGSTNRKYGGTGLGLSISKELARILHGNITVSSQPGEGSTFTLRLPLKMRESVAEIQVHAQKEDTITSPVQEPRFRKNNGEDITLLIIEDDLTFAGILKELALEWKYQVLHAVNGREGLQMAREHYPDAIILDMHMPVMDGGAVLEHLKNDPELSQIPVHVISSGDAGKNARQGVVAYLRKPVSRNELEQVFTRIGTGLTGEWRLLIWSAEKGNEETLQKLHHELPGTVQFDYADSMESLTRQAARNHYDCVLLDLNIPYDKYLEQIREIKSALLFAQTPVILLVGHEITAADEMTLRSMAEAVVMHSEEAHRRLKDELELFMFRMKKHHQAALPGIKAENFTGNNLLEGKRVLVADDDIRNVFALTGLLESQKMQVVSASNGKQAIELLESGTHIDLVLMDVMMPEMDGYEAMRYLRSRPEFRKLPVIALTAKAMAEDRELCLQAGASDYLSKPVDTNKLLSLVRIWLS